MNKFRHLIITLAMMLMIPTFQTLASSESADSQNIPLVDLPSEGSPSGDTSDEDKDDDYKKGDPSKWQRMPARPVNCTISREGVTIDGEIVAIVSFEVRDTEGNIVAIFASEQEFISFIFSSEGDFELIFRLPNRTLHGFITL